MTFTQTFQKELDREATATRKMLALVPNDKFDWKPHERSMAMGNLATHVAELPSWIPMVLDTAELDFHENAYEPKDIKTSKDLLSLFETSLADAKARLAKASDDQLDLVWTLRNGEQIYSTEPKGDVIRMSISQIIHHRAQLGVYLRLLNIPIPGSYGPSADDPSF